MKAKKKFLRVFLAVCVIFTFVPTMAFAEKNGLESSDQGPLDSEPDSAVTAAAALYPANETEDAPAGKRAANPLPVPEGALVTQGNILYGIRTSWFQEVNPDSDTLFVSVKIPSFVREIAAGALTASYQSGSNYAGTTHKDKVNGSFIYSKCVVASVDFSEAASLTAIRSQALNGNAYINGVLDLSHTSLKTLEKYAFGSCTGLTGVILPGTLEELGTSSGGSVFHGCSNLAFIRVAGGAPDAAFELPEGLRTIGSGAFQGCTKLGPNAGIPASVTAIGSQAFYQTGIKQIVIGNNTDVSNYDGGAFKDRLVICPSYSVWYTLYVKSGSYRSYLTCPVTLVLPNNETVTKLYNQSINYTKIGNTEFWELGGDSGLPDPSALAEKPGYTASWVVADAGTEYALLDKYDKLQVAYSDDAPVYATTSYSIQKPDITPVVDNVKQESFHVTVSLKDDAVGNMGVLVSHPLLKEDGYYGTDDDFVYFTYRWWDEQTYDSEGNKRDYSISGPRSEVETELFSAEVSPRDDAAYAFYWYETTPPSALPSVRIITNNTNCFRLVQIDQAVIPIRGEDDERIDGNQYMVEILGWHVVDGKAELFYKSHENFIHFINDPDVGATDGSYVFHVTVDQYYTVSFDADNGTEPSEIAVKSGESVPEPEDVPVKEGYVFLGWYPVDDSGSLGETAYDFSGPVSAPSSLKARWGKQYTVIYTDGAGEEELFGDQVFTVMDGEPTPEFDGTPRREEYVFKGWSPAVSDLVSENAVYTAQWEKIENLPEPGDPTDPTKPADQTGQISPPTGDSGSVTLWLALMGVSALGAALLCGRKRGIAR